MVLAGTACSSVPAQPPAASNPNPGAAVALPQPIPVTGSQRLQHAWNKALEGLAMGGTIAGPYGAGGGLIIGLIAGLITAESHYNGINNQIVTEQQKDRQLEAAVEQELARQRDLEKQIAAATGPAGPSPDQPDSQTVAATSPQPSPVSQPPVASQRATENVNLASLSKPATPQPSPMPFKNVEVKDINGDGIPDLWVYYNPQKPAEIIRQEEASKGDGRVNTWGYFKDGLLVRREVDSRGQGRPDTIFYYFEDKIAREERDENGHGRMTYRATYENGRLAKVEKESNGNGRTDLWIYYDTGMDGEIVLKEERDLNGDGIVDLWSHFDNGRLARRDVSATGLEILTTQEQLPVSTADLRQSTPGTCRAC
jgi:hypothetical protein